MSVKLKIGFFYYYKTTESINFANVQLMRKKDVLNPVNLVEMSHRPCCSNYFALHYL